MEEDQTQTYDSSHYYGSIKEYNGEMPKMDNVENSVKQLIAAILESDTYKEYDLQRNKVNQNPELRKQIDEFRRRNYELQTHNSAFDKIDEFEKEFAGFREIPLVSDFLAAELAFCRMMQDVNIKITAALNFE